MRVDFSNEAEDDLEAIADWIAADNPVRAMSFVDELRDCCAGVGRQPKAYVLVPGFELRGVRRRVHGSYIVLYRIDPGAVYIMHILHGSRDYLSLLAGED